MDDDAELVTVVVIILDRLPQYTYLHMKVRDWVTIGPGWGSNKGQVLDNFLCVLSLTRTRLSSVEGKKNMTIITWQSSNT